MNDPFESSLRATLKTISIAHDDSRADEMISLATAGAPLPERRHVLAPLAAAAAVIAVGTTVAVVAQHGDDPAPSGNPVGAPTTATRTALPEDVEVTVAYSGVAAPHGKTVRRGYAVTYFPQGPNEPPNSPFWLTLENFTADKVTVSSPPGDRAGFQLVSGKKVVVNTVVSGATRTTLTFPSTNASGLRPVVQCRVPAHGTTCLVSYELHGVVHRPFGTKTPLTRSDTPYVPAPRRAPSTTASSGAPPSSRSGPVYTPPTPPSDTPSCSGCQIP